MILPSLISLSVAPGSYFFCARADVVANTAAASMARAASLLRQPGIVLSPVFCSLVLLGVSQGDSRLASAAIFREVKRRLATMSRAAAGSERAHRSPATRCR